MDELRWSRSAVLLLVLSFAGCPAPEPVPDEDTGPTTTIDGGRTDGGGGIDAPIVPVDAPIDAGDPCADPDRDGDGEDAIGCGGADCDDDDPQRAPTRSEFCDPANRDEDCDPTTYGVRDLDLDGHPDGRCCNTDSDGVELCGVDCDDTRATVSPTAPEVCNGSDDDCNGVTDEGVTVELWPDGDGDGYGDDRPTAVSVAGCPGRVGYATLRGDCNELAPGIHVGAPEVCNAIDDDCDVRVDDIAGDAVFCRADQDRPCTVSCGGVSVSGTESCSANCLSWDRCVGDEVCNGCDDDGDGVADEDFECIGDTGVNTCVTACGTTGNRACRRPTCTLDTCRAPEVCNFCDDDMMNGTADERALATLNDPARPLYGGIASGSVRYVGGATEDAVPGGGGSDIVAILLDGTTDVDTGGVWFDLNRYQGWGTTTVHIEMEVRAISGGMPYGGWSVLVADGGSGDLGPGDNGPPTTRRGIFAEWAWSLYERVPSTMPGAPVASDGGRYGRMTGSFWRWEGTVISNEGFTQVDFGSMFDGQPSWTRQDVTIVYTPENLATPGTEENATVYFGGSSRTFFPDSNAATYDPANDLPTATDPSRVLSIGVIATTSRYTDPYSGDTLSANVEARMRLRRFELVGGGPGGPSLVWTDHSTIARNGICPGGSF